MHCAPFNLGNFVLFGITALSQALYTFLVDLSNERSAIPSGLKRHERLNEKIGQRKTTFDIEYLIFCSPAPCGVG